MLFHLMKLSRPVIANMIQELLKVNDGAKSAAFYKLYNMVKYMFDTRNFRLMVEPSGNEGRWCVIATAVMMEIPSPGKV